MDKVDWNYLSANPCATHILEKNIDKIDWNGLSINTYDYAKEKISEFNKLKLFPSSGLKFKIIKS